MCGRRPAPLCGRQGPLCSLPAFGGEFSASISDYFLGDNSWKSLEGPAATCQRLTPAWEASQTECPRARRDRDIHLPFEVLTPPAPGSGGERGGSGRVPVFRGSLGLKVIEPLRSNPGQRKVMPLMQREASHKRHLHLNGGLQVCKSAFPNRRALMVV